MNDQSTMSSQQHTVQLPLSQNEKDPGEDEIFIIEIVRDAIQREMPFFTNNIKHKLMKCLQRDNANEFLYQVIKNPEDTRYDVILKPAVLNDKSLSAEAIKKIYTVCRDQVLAIISNSKLDDFNRLNN